MAVSASASTRPYLIRAIHEWAIDNGFTPQIVVDAEVDGVQVPAAYVQDGKITLNIHPDAVSQFELGNEWILFAARFSGKHVEVGIPVQAVEAVFARETGQGIVFNHEDPDFPDRPDTAGPGKEDKGPKKKTSPHLRVVK
jgi:stringent starvation protein B